MAYTKLFSSIVTSTIWAEDNATRIVWITMMALADKNGEVQASVPGLARVAGVTLKACEAALEKFMGPDLYSRTPDEGGKRIEKIEGGWSLLNHSKYRTMASKEESVAANAERQRRFKRRKAGMGGEDGICVYCGDVSTGPDHVIPTSKGGANDETNVVHACGRCNQHKGIQSVAAFLNDPTLGFQIDHKRVMGNPILKRLLTFSNGCYDLVTHERDIAEADAYPSLERERAAGAGDHRRPTLEQAKSAALNIGIPAAKADEWWNAREASDWMKGMAGGSTVPVGMNWQADLKTYSTRGPISGGGSSNTTPKEPLPKLEWE